VRGTWLRAGVLLAVLAAGTIVALTVELPDVDKGVLLVGPVPRAALCVLLGVVLGFWTGAAVAYAGGLVGALAAFGLSRTLGRDTAVRLVGPRLTAVDRALAGRGFVAVLVARLLPVAPFSVLSHAAGLTAVPFGAYAAGSALGLVPTTVLQVGVGASVPGLTVWAARAGAPVVAVTSVVLVADLASVWSWRARRTRTGTPAT
jgi:uncharacterized membrane protein YdjX (TVP38/TMEM64 family)